MAWRRITVEDITSALSSAEIDAFGESWPSDTASANIDEVTAYVRGVIRSSPHAATLGPEGTLPDSLILPTVDYLRFRLLTRFDLTVNEARTKAYDDAKEVFDRIRSGEYVPESSESGSVSSKCGSPASGSVHPHRLLD